MYKNLKLSIISSILILAFSSSVYSGIIEKKTKEGMNTKTILVTVLGSVAGAGIYFLSGDQDNSEYDNTLSKQMTSDASETEEAATGLSSYIPSYSQVHMVYQGASLLAFMKYKVGPSIYNLALVLNQLRQPCF